MISQISYTHLIVLVVAVVLILAVVLAIVVTARDETLSLGQKASWVGALVLLPVAGLVVWTAARVVRRRRLDATR